MDRRSTSRRPKWRAALAVADSRLLRWWWIVPVVGLVTFVALRPSALEQVSEDLERPPTEAPLVIDDRAMPEIAAPVVGSSVLPLLTPEVRPAAPTQWAQAGVPIPFGQWWSGLATGPDIPALWAKPLLLRMGDDGRADLSAPQRTERADGLRDARVTPAIFFEFGGAARVRVIDHGPLHIRFAVVTDDAEVIVTMVQGSPFLEIEGWGSLIMTVPALSGLEQTRAAPTADRFSTAAGSWILASSQPSMLSVDGDRVELVLQNGVSHVVGPVPDGADGGYDDVAARVAAAPLLDSVEELTVAEDGSVRQTLSVLRDGTTTNTWALLPHHIDFIASSPEVVGELDSIHGRAPVVVESNLTLDYPAVPTVWDVPAPSDAVDFDAAALIPEGERPDLVGSYFGAKEALTDALVHDVLRASGSERAGAPFMRAATDAVLELFDPETAPALAWEPAWGSVVVTPPEFGAAEQLNDHHLQNGYWVAAAASVVVADPANRAALQPGIDLLIADYAGTAVVPEYAGVVSDEGVWSGFAGHGWASGVGGFGAGNSLESISESSHAWWAAAKWFLATDRPELADAFIARFTIESWLTGYEWLPTAAHQPEGEDVRPWSGVVWSGKVDAGTWFSAADEAALGIRLIPLGPQSFARYPDASAINAAGDRWTWCDRFGSGCASEWWNLLDSDAAVAGRPALAPGPQPEPTTTEMVRQWWRTHWDTSEVAPDWSCSPGVVVRRLADGPLVALTTNPSSRSVTATCRQAGGSEVELVVDARSARTVLLAN